MENNFQTIVTTKTGKQILIRFPEPSDLAQLLVFANELIAEDTYTTLTGSPLSQQEETQFLQTVLSQIANKKAVYLYAFDGEKLIANCSIVKQGKRKEDVGLFGIAILASYRNEGLGQKLMKLLFEKAKEIGIRRVVLEVYSENQVGIALYEKMGFQKAGIFPKHIWYKENLMDEIFMYKDL